MPPRNVHTIVSTGKNLMMARKVVLIGVASLVVTSFAQPAAPRSATQATAAIPLPPGFEVSTVKRNNSGNSHSQPDFHGGRFTASNVTLKNMLQ